MANFIVQMRTRDGVSYSVGYSSRWASRAAWVGDVGPGVMIALANVGSALTLCAAASLRSLGKADLADRVSHIIEPINLLDRAILRIVNPLKGGVETFRIIRCAAGSYRLENEIAGELTAHMLLQAARMISDKIEQVRCAADLPEDIGLETLDSADSDDSDDG
ncbi:MAG: hypothetical protein COU35_03760 [Candidatus Magasanikbacteria bacterium CG10_big_fil_rev_8_21_14_0_10_47_10]|uniref:Uncharacterized protein n=1 Tax=Candidatus Magasanikbacteria bacterium CG10_big_fil_rev_8_21_14_0_10_47_10 TaxID=1974652 RepID=A0A2H0TRW0_9BACT|nr:MAG: hypothetical protein COU35_03760 [Candidatus Magasanikbacteria bacterium CG10_big_fil_rev_8_21_14_0_10_47_10]